MPSTRGIRRRNGAVPKGPVRRLTASDLSSLRYETPATPMHIGAVVVAEGGPLLDTAGRLRLDLVRRRIALRLQGAPILRQRLFVPGPVRGRPLWVDDEAFDIASHVREVRLSHAAGEGELFHAAERLMGALLDRSRPLWELWFVTGLSDDRDQVGALGNAVGVMSVSVPVGAMDARRRLESIIASTRDAKERQHPEEVEAFVSLMAATPLGHRFISHQRLINVEVTNVAGPAMPVYALGARVIDLVPIVSPAENVTISFCAFSYAACLYLVATADRAACPDIDRLMIGARREWSELCGSPRSEGPSHARVAYPAGRR